MGLLKKIFKKKPGGTFLGNMIRGVASKATGGLSDAVLKAPPKEAATPAPTPQQQQAMDIATTAGANLINKELAPLVQSGVYKVANTTAGQNLLDAATGAVMQSAQKSIKVQIMDTLKKYWWIAAFPICGVIYLLIKKGSNNKRPSYGRKY